jgi:hypothetical protein
MCCVLCVCPILPFLDGEPAVAQPKSDELQHNRQAVSCHILFYQCVLLVLDITIHVLDTINAKYKIYLALMIY